MTIDIDVLLRIVTLMLSAVAVLWSVGTWIYVRNDSRAQQVDAAIEALQLSVTKLESEFDHLPSHDDLARIHSRIDELSDGISHLSGEFVGVKNTLNLIHEYLLKGQ